MTDANKLSIEGVKKSIEQKSFGQRMADKFGATLEGEDAQQITLRRGTLFFSMGLGDGEEAAEARIKQNYFNEE